MQPPPLTSRVTEDEATHGDTEAEDEGPPGQVLDGAVIEDSIVLLDGGVGPGGSRSLRRELGLGHGGLDLRHDVSEAHDEQPSEDG